MRFLPVSGERRDTVNAPRLFVIVDLGKRPALTYINEMMMPPRRFPPPWRIEETVRLFDYAQDTWQALTSGQRGEHMPAYLIAQHIVTDPAKFHEYVTKVGPMMAKHGARYLTKGSTHKLPEGGHWKPERVVIIEFPDMDALNGWYNSPEYQPLIALRKSCTSDQDMLFVLEGA
jgi:uncharacterized protein (DUF1330 family)